MTDKNPGIDVPEEQMEALIDAIVNKKGEGAQEEALQNLVDSVMSQQRFKDVASKASADDLEKLVAGVGQLVMKQAIATANEIALNEGTKGRSLN